MAVDIIKKNYLQWSIAPEAGENILITGNRNAQAILKKISHYCRGKNAIPHLNIFSDEDIISAINSTPTPYRYKDPLENFWIPTLIDKNRFILKAEEYTFDKIILLFSYFIHHIPDGSVPWREILSASFKKNLKNLDDYSHNKIKTILLEYPPHPEMEKYYKEALAVDYEQMATLNRKLVEILKNSMNLHLTCPLGSDLTLVKGDREILNEDCSFAGDHIFQLPGGEVFFAPIENLTDGQVFCQGESMGLDEPIRLVIRNGVLKEVSGDYDTGVLEQIDRLLDTDREIVGEFGIGTNDMIKIKSSCSLYEKKLGTVHIGIGENIYYGGKHTSERHIDLVVEEPTVYADHQPLIINGKLQIG